MDDGPVKLVPRPVQSNGQVVEYLQNVLEEAKAGNVSEMVCMYKKNGQWNHTWTYADDLHSLIGALTVILHRQVKRVVPDQGFGG